MIKSKKFLMLMLTLMVSVVINAKVEIEGLYYNLNSETKEAEVTSGNNGNNRNSYSGDIVIPSTVTYEGTEYKVTSIGEKAFHGCYRLNTLEIPASVTYIKDQAFYGMSTPLVVTDLSRTPQKLGVNVFDHSRFKLYVPVGCKTVYEAADEQWNNLTIIDGAIKHIAVNSAECDAVIYYEINTETKEAEVISGDTKYTGSIVIPSTFTYEGAEYKVISIGDKAFYESDLGYVEIPNTVTSIGEEAFWYCQNLEYLTIPESIKNVGKDAFRFCHFRTLYNLARTPQPFKPDFNVGLMYVLPGCRDAYAAEEGWKMFEIKDDETWPVVIYKKDDSTPKFYKVNMAIGEAEVTSMGYDFIGLDYYLYSRLSESVVIPSTVTYGGKEYKVTGIGDRCFSDYAYITSVTIPNTVTSIGKAAFAGCSKLASVVIPNSVTSIGRNAFQECSALTSVTIPDKVTKIEYQTFTLCSGLTSVTIPNSVTSIGENAFYDCVNLASVNIPNFVTSIGDAAFCGTNIASVTIPNTVTEIGNYAFGWCPNLTSIKVEANNKVYNSHNNCNAIIETATNKLIAGCKNSTIPNGVLTIANRAFGGSTGLTSIEIPNSVKTLETGAFMKTGLTSVTIPEYATTIESGVFSDCSALTSVTIPESVTTIGNGAFNACSALTSVIIPKSVTTINPALFADCSSLTSVTIQNTVTSIGYRAFANCSALTSITIPESVTTIEQEAFYGCSSLTSVTIPNSVKSIEKLTFADCSNLTSVVIPNSVTSIGNMSFYSTNLTSIVIPESVTSIGYAAFAGTGNKSLISVTNLAKEPQDIGNNEVFSVYGTLHVLPGCKAAYESAKGWALFTIVEDADQPAEITNVSSLIGNIGNVEFTEACKAKIDAARSAYNALTKEQQALVKNYSVLVDAENAYKQLEATGIADVETKNGNKDGKYLENGKLVIVKNGKKYNLNGLAE